MKRIVCWLRGHRPWSATTLHRTVVLRDGWDTPVATVQLCERCLQPYFVTSF